MTPQGAIDTVTAISQQSDRWIFVALLAIGIFACWVLFRHFTARECALESKIDRIGKRGEEQTQQFISYLQSANRELAAILNETNSTLNKNAALMERVERKLEKFT
jgi:type VI protein secretion system component VasK